MTINKKIIRTMLENKSQYLGSLLLIVLSCLMFTMFNLLSDNMGRLFSNFSADYSQEDADFMTDSPVSDIAELEAKYDLLIEEGKTFDYSLTGDKLLRIFTENTKVNIPAVIKGSGLKEGGILIDPAFAKANKLAVGSSITIEDKTFRVQGLMSLPNYIYPLKSDGDLMSDPNTFGIAVIGKEDFDDLGQGNAFYQIRFKDRNREPEAQMTGIKEYLYDSGITITSWMNTSVNPKVTMVTAKMKGISSVSSTMPVAILLLTCILTAIVMRRMIKREGPIIGTLYALGYRKKEIRNHYISYPLTVAVMGGVAGTVLGSLLLSPMLNFMVMYFNMPVDKIDFSIRYVVISLLLPIVFLGAAGLLSIRKALKSSPLKLMRGSAEADKLGFIERNIRLEHFKFPTKFKIREQLGSIARSAFLLLGVILATMLLLLGFTAKNSMDSLMQKGFEEAYQYDYSYVFNKLQSSTPSGGEAFSEVPFSLTSDDKVGITVFGVSPGSRYVSFKDNTGNSISTDKVIMTKGLADKLKLKSGDTLRVTDKLNSKEYDITVESIAQTYVGNYIHMPLSKLNSMLKLPAGSYMGLWSSDKLDIPADSLLTTVSKDEIRNAFNAITAPIQTVVGITAFLSFLIGLLVIYVVTTLIIEENKENISLLKILGYHKKEVYSMILNSSVFAVILGYVLGVPALIASLGAMFNSITKEMTFSLPITVNYVFLLIGFAVIYVTYFISRELSKRKVNRISMNEILKARLE